MRRSLALSILAAFSGSTYAEPVSAAGSHPSKPAAAQTQTAQPSELTESQRIMLEIRRQVGNELNEK